MNQRKLKCIGRPAVRLLDSVEEEAQVTPLKQTKTYYCSYITGPVNISPNDK
jgi:hypothetical protein